MAGKIRGITIELSGDTKGLVKSLNDANKSTKEVQKQLKDVNKVLKFDPKSTELLTQKQNLLKENVEKTKEQLDKEKKALEELQNAGDSDKTVKQQEALQRQIAETEARLKSAEDEFKSFGSVGTQQIAAVGGQMQELGGKIADVGDTLTKKVTAPIVAFGGLSVAAFNEVDAGMDTIAAKTGATGDELESMQNIMKDIATTIPTDFQTAGNAVGEVNTRFGVTGDALEDLSTKFIQFAELNNTDVSSSIDSVQSAMATFGLSADDAGAFLDTLNAVGQETGVNVDRLAQSMVTNGTAMQEMGFSASDSAHFLGGLDKAGVDASAVMTGLKKALANAAKEGKPMDKALQDVQSSILNASTDTEAMNAAMDLFGNKAGPAMASAIRDGRLSLDELGTSLQDNLGNLQTTFDTTLDPVDTFQTTMNQLKITGAEVGSTLLDILGPALEKVAEVVKAVGEWWSGLSPEMQQTITTVGLVVAALGPVLSIGGRIISGIGTIMSLAPMLGTALTVLTGPVGVVVAAVAGLIAIGVALYKNWDTIKETATRVWNNIKTFFSNTLNAIKTTFSNIWNGIKNTVSNIINGIKNTISGVWNTIKNITSSAFQTVKNLITNPIETAKNTVKNLIDRIKGFFNFKWSLPKLKLPHVSISGSFSLMPPRVPHFSIDWYKQAAKRGAIFTKPTIFGMQNGRFLGAGDSRDPEALLGINSMQSMITGAVNQGMNSEGLYNAVVRGMQNVSMQIFLDGKDITQNVNMHNTSSITANLRVKGAY